MKACLKHKAQPDLQIQQLNNSVGVGILNSSKQTLVAKGHEV